MDGRPGEVTSVTGLEFRPGDRVVVRSHDPSMGGPDLTGHYGHVREIIGNWVAVDVEGAIPGVTIHQPALNFGYGWAFWSHELEHAD